MELAVAAKTDVEFDVANRVFFRLYQASNLMHKQGTRYVGPFGATTQQWAVLGALARPLVRDDGMMVKDLMEFLDVSRQNLTAVLDRLEARGWIKRVKDKDDGRSRLVRLTGEGNKIWARMQEPIEAFYSAALSTFSHDDQVLLYRLLDRLKTAGRARHRSANLRVFFCTSYVAANGLLKCLQSVCTAACRRSSPRPHPSRLKTQRRTVARLQARMIAAGYSDDFTGDK